MLVNGKIVEERVKFCPDHGDTWKFKSGEKVKCCAIGGCNFEVEAKREEDKKLETFAEARRDWQ